MQDTTICDGDGMRVAKIPTFLCYAELCYKTIRSSGALVLQCVSLQQRQSEQLRRQKAGEDEMKGNGRRKENRSTLISALSETVQDGRCYATCELATVSMATASATKLLALMTTIQ